jgi:hypothetical protein
MPITAFSLVTSYHSDLRRWLMVNCCINPACRIEFRLLNSGDLYAIERPSAETEFFWICADCASRFSLVLDPAGTVSLRPRGKNEQGYPPQLQARLRLVAHARRHMPWRNAVPAGAGLRVGKSGDWGAPIEAAYL